MRKLKLLFVGLFSLFMISLCVWADSPTLWRDVTADKLILHWVPNQYHDTVEIYAYNYSRQKKELLGKFPAADEKYEIDITCNFIKTYTKNYKSIFTFYGVVDSNKSMDLNFDVEQSIYDNKGCNGSSSSSSSSSSNSNTSTGSNNSSSSSSSSSNNSSSSSSSSSNNSSSSSSSSSNNSSSSSSSSSNNSSSSSSSSSNNSNSSSSSSSNNSSSSSSSSSNSSSSSSSSSSNSSSSSSSSSSNKSSTKTNTNTTSSSTSTDGPSSTSVIYNISNGSNEKLPNISHFFSKERDILAFTWDKKEQTKDFEFSLYNFVTETYDKQWTVPAHDWKLLVPVSCTFLNNYFSGGDIIFKYKFKGGVAEKKYSINTSFPSNFDCSKSSSPVDLKMADISHSYNMDFSKLTLTWAALATDEKMRISAYDGFKNEYVVLGTAPFTDQKYVIPISCSFLNTYAPNTNIMFKFDTDGGTSANFYYVVSAKLNSCSSSTDIANIDLSSNFSHQVTTGTSKLTFRWNGKSGNTNKIKFNALNTSTSGFDYVGSAPYGSGKYEMVVSCDFLSSHHNGEEIVFEISPYCGDGSRCGKTLIYSVAISKDTCRSTTSATPNSSSNTTGSNLNSSINRNTSNIKGVPIKWSWYDYGNAQELQLNGFTREKNNAYKFAHHYGMTTYGSIETANMEGSITRAAMAKVIAKFAKNIMGLEPDKSKSCYFSDVTEDLDRKYSNGITESCQLGIMGVNISKFKPYDNIIRAEFGTILSRLLFSNSDGDPYYEPHLRSLSSRGIITNADPFKIEKRGNVFLMLMRATQSVLGEIKTFDIDGFNTTTVVEKKEEVKEEPKEPLVRNSSDEDFLMSIVQGINPALVEMARNIYSGTYVYTNISGANMANANICSVLKNGEDIVSFYWDPQLFSRSVEVQLYDEANTKYVNLGTFPMSRGYFQYRVSTGEKADLSFLFKAKDSDGEGFKYSIQPWRGRFNDCKVAKHEMPGEAIIAEDKLGNTAEVLGMLIPSMKEKSSSTINRFRSLMKTYSENNDDKYLKYIGIYFGYLLSNI